MRFLVLGPLEVEADNGPVVLGGQKERLLLAQLLTRPNQVVPVEALLLGAVGRAPAADRRQDLAVACGAAAAGPGARPCPRRRRRGAGHPRAGLPATGGAGGAGRGAVRGVDHRRAPRAWRRLGRA